MRRERTEGAVVNVLSVNAHCGLPELAAYSASKGGLAATLTRNAANALAPDRIRVNGIYLGWTDTPAEHAVQERESRYGADWLAHAAASQPFGRLIDPEELADLIAFLAQPARRRDDRGADRLRAVGAGRAHQSAPQGGRTMKTIKGPAHLPGAVRRRRGAVQLAATASPNGPLASATRACRSRPGTRRLFDLTKAATSKTYCDEVNGIAPKHGVAITELSTHLQGQLVAVHPAYDEAFDGFAPPRGARQPEGAAGLGGGADASGGAAPRSNLGLDRARRPSPARSPGPILYPWPQRPAGLIETAFDELARRWRPILDAFDEAGVDVCYETPSGRGPVRRRHLRDVPRARRTTTRAATSTTTPRTSCCSSSTISTFIDIYHERIKAFHVKDAEFNPTGRQGVYSRLPALGEPRRPLPLARRRAGRFRRRSSRSWPQYDYRRLGGARMGMLPQAPRGRRARRRALHRATTSSASPRRPSTTSPAAAPTGRPTAHARHLT